MALVRNHPHPNYPLFRMKIGVMPDFSGSKWSDQEIPREAPDGIRRTFTLENAPMENTETVYKDGMLMARGLDYTVDYLNKKITFRDDELVEDGVDDNGQPVHKTINGQIPQLKSVIRVSYKFMNK